MFCCLLMLYMYMYMYICICIYLLIICSHLSSFVAVAAHASVLIIRIKSTYAGKNDTLNFHQLLKRLMDQFFCSFSLSVCVRVLLYYFTTVLKKFIWIIRISTTIPIHSNLNRMIIRWSISNHRIKITFYSRIGCPWKWLHNFL